MKMHTPLLGGVFKWNKPNAITKKQSVPKEVETTLKNLSTLVSKEEPKMSHVKNFLLRK